MNFSFATKHKIIDILIEKNKKKLIVKNIFIIVKKIR